MFNLGRLYARMEPPDLDAARHWWERGADAGNSNAMFNLGVLHEQREPPDLDAARHWYERGADAGNGDAMYNLANLRANSKRAWWRRGVRRATKRQPG
jgi:hypothetical protein